MHGEPAVTTYRISEPFDRALRAVREALTRADLSVVSEVDVSARVKRELNMGFVPCRILLVDSPCLLLEAAALDRAAAALMPLHLVISARGPETLVCWMSPTAIEGVRLPMAAAQPLLKLQAMLTRVMEQIAMPRAVSVF
jgi:uncharacterized protein (DUF302 family)